MAATTVVTEKFVAKICDDIGTCWHDLGIALNISLETLCNIDSDNRRSREKGKDMLNGWIKNKGSSATVQCLIDALNEIGQRRIAEKLQGTRSIINSPAIYFFFLMLAIISQLRNLRHVNGINVYANNNLYKRSAKQINSYEFVDRQTAIFVNSEVTPATLQMRDNSFSVTDPIVILHPLPPNF